jgi:hypothetical protein
MPDDAILINELAANELLKTVDDSTRRNLLLLGLAQARMRAVRPTGVTDQAWRASLPQAPFDMLFFSQILLGMFADRGLIEGVLRGQDPAELTGWVG